MPATIDLNADLGEGFGTSRLAGDEALLDIVSSANIACGYHAGDATSMRETVRSAEARGVTIGAHPSYPDIQGAGRRELKLPPREITRHVTTQIAALLNICTAERTRMRYVKPHGALYNRAVVDRPAADAIATAMRDVDHSLVLLGLAGSEMKAAAERAGLRFASEAFADRGYQFTGSLVPRDKPGAYVTSVAEAVERARRLVRDRVIATVDGKQLRVVADSLCVHGDNPDARELLLGLRRALENDGVVIGPFAT